MKAVPQIQLTEKKRQNIASALFVTHMLTIVTSLMLVGNGLYIKFVIESRIVLTANYNNDVLPWVMIIIGILNFLVCLVGALLCNQTRLVNNRHKTRDFQLPYVCVALVSALCVFCVAMLSFGHVPSLHASFTDGILQAMRLYKTDREVKKEIDNLQIDFDCCGSTGYEDWFSVSWVSNDYLNLDSESVKKQLKANEFFSDDVPFSCCDPDARRPCIHHFVTADKRHYEYNHDNETTLYDDGCRDALMDYFSTILQESSVVILFIFVIELMNILGIRFLQTSVHHALECGVPESEAPGWLFGSLPKETVYESMQRSSLSRSTAVSDISFNDSLAKTMDTAPTNVPAYENPTRRFSRKDSVTPSQPSNGENVYSPIASDPRTIDTEPTNVPSSEKPTIRFSRIDSVTPSQPSNGEPIYSQIASDPQNH